MFVGNAALQPDQIKIEAYSRKSLTEKLAGVLNKMKD
jgi:hypothetical protein